MSRSAWGFGSSTVEHWSELANCDLTVSRWFDVSANRRYGIRVSANNGRALTLCASCAVKAECLEQAVRDHAPGWRIAGGMLVGAYEVRDPLRIGGQ